MTQYRWVICAMLFFATTVNYLDRQVLSLTWDEFIKPEFHWNEYHYGLITSIFSIVLSWQPGTCSPSRSVVSNTNNLSLISFSLLFYQFGLICKCMRNAKTETCAAGRYTTPKTIKIVIKN